MTRSKKSGLRSFTVDIIVKMTFGDPTWDSFSDFSCCLSSKCSNSLFLWAKSGSGRSRSSNWKPSVLSTKSRLKFLSTFKDSPLTMGTLPVTWAWIDSLPITSRAATALMSKTMTHFLQAFKVMESTDNWISKMVLFTFEVWSEIRAFVIRSFSVYSNSRVHALVNVNCLLHICVDWDVFVTVLILDL